MNLVKKFLTPVAYSALFAMTIGHFFTWNTLNGYSQIAK